MHQRGERCNGCHVMLTTDLGPQWESVWGELGRVGWKWELLNYTTYMVAAVGTEDTPVTVRLPRAVPSLP